MPENTSTPKAKRTEIGSKRLLKAKVWRAICKAEELLERKDDMTALKAINSLATAAGVYAKVLFGEEMEERVRTLEEALKGRV